MRRPLILLGVLVIAGCTDPDAPQHAEEALRSASLQGTHVVGDALLVLDARLTVAPRDAAPLGTPQAPARHEGRTQLHQDHWTLRLDVQETRPHALAGPHHVALEWNGEPRGAITLLADDDATAERATLAYDLGPRLETSSVYLLTVTRAEPTV